MWNINYQQLIIIDTDVCYFALKVFQVVRFL